MENSNGISYSYNIIRDTQAPPPIYYVTGKTKNKSFQFIMDNNLIKIIDLSCCGAKFLYGINDIYNSIFFPLEEGEKEDIKNLVEDFWYMIDYILEYYECSVISCILAEHSPNNLIKVLREYNFMPHLTCFSSSIGLNRNSDNELHYIHFRTAKGEENYYEDYEENYYEEE
jgi:hypothetical protein